MLVILDACASSDRALLRASSASRCCVASLNRADAFQSAIQISDHVSVCAEMLVGAVWHPQADLVLKVAAAVSRQLDLLRQQREVFWVDSGRDPFERQR